MQLITLKFRVGDKVTFTNEDGVVFKGHSVIGYCEPEHILYKYGARYYINTECYWYPVKECELSAE